MAMFKHCPTLSDHADKADQIHSSWREYKMAVPTYGAIILDPTYQYVSKSYSMLLSDKIVPSSLWNAKTNGKKIENIF